MLSKVPAEIVYIVSDYLDHQSTKTLAVSCSRLHKLLADRVWHSINLDLTQSSDDLVFGRKDADQLYQGIKRGVLDGLLESLKIIYIKVNGDPDENCTKLIELIPERCGKLQKVRIQGTVSSCPSVIAKISSVLENQYGVDVRVCLGVDTSWGGLLSTMPIVKNLTLKFQRDRYEGGLLLPNGIEDLSIYCNRISQKALTKILSGIDTLQKLRIDTYSLTISSMTWLPNTVKELRFDLSEIIYEGKSLDRQRMEIASVTSLHAALLSLEPLEDVLFPNLQLLNIQNVPQHIEVLPTSTKTRELWLCSDILLNESIRENHHDRFETITHLVVYGIEPEFPYFEALDSFPRLARLHLMINTKNSDMRATIGLLQSMLLTRPLLKEVFVYAPDWCYTANESTVVPNKRIVLMDRLEFLKTLDCDDESDVFGGPSYWIEDII